MNRSLTNSVKRREFLKSTGLVAGAALTGLDFPMNVLAQSNYGPTRFTQAINEVQLYMTYYAFFEEPDDDVPPAIYFDALTGQPTGELTLIPPIGQRSWIHPGPDEATIVASQLDS